jgi:hypothetical protein
VGFALVNLHRPHVETILFQQHNQMIFSTTPSVSPRNGMVSFMNVVGNDLTAVASQKRGR